MSGAGRPSSYPSYAFFAGVDMRFHFQVRITMGANFLGFEAHRGERDRQREYNLSFLDGSPWSAVVCLVGMGDTVSIGCFGV